MIPVNTTATVYVLAKRASDVTEGNTTAEESDGAQLLGAENGIVAYLVGSGKYSFTIYGKLYYHNLHPLL